MGWRCEAVRKGPRLIGLFCVAAGCAFAHDIPNDVTAQMYVRPAGQQLQVLMRVPLRAIRDVVFPERDGFLDIAATEPLLPDASTQWLSDFVELYEDESRLPKKPRVMGARISLDSDRSFESYDRATAHIAGPSLPAGTNVAWNQTLLDVWFAYPIRAQGSAFSIHPVLGRLGLRVVTALRFVLPDGTVRAFEFTGDPGLVRLDPRWHQAALRFVQEGFLHILDGTDHLLFLVCLVIPLRRFRALIPVVTAFTVAHSITLIASAYDLGPDALWFPPLIETLIAVSIVYMALENIVGGATVERRWVMAFGFGLVHGFGFSFALKQALQFAGSHLLTSLLSFNVGVELGQLLVLVLLVPLLEFGFRHVVAERMGTILLSALVAHTGWHWMLERGDKLRQYRFEWPTLTAQWLAGAMRWAMAAVILAAAIWLVRSLRRRPIEPSPPQSAR